MMKLAPVGCLAWCLLLACSLLNPATGKRMFIRVFSFCLTLAITEMYLQVSIFSYIHACTNNDLCLVATGYIQWCVVACMSFRKLTPSELPKRIGAVLINVD